MLLASKSLLIALNCYLAFETVHDDQCCGVVFKGCTSSFHVWYDDVFDVLDHDHGLLVGPVLR